MNSSKKGFTNKFFSVGKKYFTTSTKSLMMNPNISVSSLQTAARFEFFANIQQHEH